LEIKATNAANCVQFAAQQIIWNFPVQSSSNRLCFVYCAAEVWKFMALGLFVVENLLLCKT
jgi:hypothetical protein